MKKLSSILIICCALQVAAQQDPQFTQYWVNSALINPAHTSVNNNTSLNLSGRYQWTSMRGAPQTHTLSFMTKATEKLGVGGSYVLDRIGPSLTNNVNLDLAYHAK